jgi:hypothetical protein
MKKTKGSATPALIITAAVMVTTLLGLLLVISYQFDYSQRQLGGEKALNVAEAGINYYKWHLAHDPEDFQDGTGSDGPYTHEYKDPQGNRIGEYTLTITPPENGSSVVSIVAEGKTDEYPNLKRTIEARYGVRSLSDYSFLSNASSWYGGGITVNGRVHSNNGIRMDGTNTSIVSSAQETYHCGSETGCYPPEWMPGVWGSGGDQALWQFPTTNFDFDLISLDMADLRTAAQETGIYLEESGEEGYHLIFNGSQLTVNRITDTGRYRSYDVSGQGIGQGGLGGCRWRYERIDDEESVGTYDIEDITSIFVEDNVWVEGQVDARLTLAAASFPIASSNVDIWIEDSITYASYDGSNVLGLISQDNIFFTRNIPENFQIDAVLMAQRGKIIRFGYLWWCGGGSHSVKDSLTINGALISYYKSYWNFNSGPDSGFVTRTINYDGNLIFDPPPYFPTTGEYELISWEER